MTNYCGLILKLLYQENPNSFEEVLVSFSSNDLNLNVGPNFSQQTKEGNSIPDLRIGQESFVIFFETKRKGQKSFDEKQLKGHIKALDEEYGARNKLLFALGNFEMDDPDFDKIEEIAEEKSVFFSTLSFETLVDTLEEIPTSERFSKMLQEFREFLDREGNLPKWKTLLDVVNCKKSKKEIIDKKAYICPDTGGPYSHRRSKYFGVYANKAVSCIFEIIGVVSIGINQEEISVKWKNVEIEDDKICSMAEKVLSKKRVEDNKGKPLEVFLLENAEKTNFKKESLGPLWGTKIYFENVAIDCENSRELAEKLKGKKWKDFR